MNIEDLPAELIYEISDIDACRKVNERWGDIGDSVIQQWFDISHLGPKYRSVRKPKLNLTYGNTDNSMNKYKSYDDSIKDIYKCDNDPIHDFQLKTLTAEIKGINIDDYYYEDRGVYDDLLCKDGPYKINMAKKVTLNDGSSAAVVSGLDRSDFIHSFIHRPMWKVFSRQDAINMTKYNHDTLEIYKESNNDIREQNLQTQPKNGPSVEDNDTADECDNKIVRMMEIALFKDDYASDIA